MKISTKKISDTKVQLTVTLDAKDLEPIRNLAIKNLSANLKVPGFRAGKVPASVALKNLDVNIINTETLDIAPRSTLTEAITSSKTNAIAVNKVDITKYVPEEILEYTAEIDIVPEVKLGDFKKLKAKMDDPTPADKDVQEVLDNIVNAYAEQKPVKRAAKLEDEVIIDFTGKKDGVAFDGGAAKDYHLTLGSGQFIPGFEDGIVGHEVGDKFDLELTFPKDYGVADLAGAKTVFEVLLKQVNEKTKPALDDELAKKCGNFQTVDDLRTDITKNLETQNRHKAFEKYRDDLVGDLVKKSTVSAPEILINDQLKFIRDDVTRNAESRGMTFESMLKMSNQTEEDWEKEASKVAEERVKASLVLQILARDNNIQADDEEVDAKIAELKDVYKNSKEAIENLSKPEVRMDIKNRLTIDKTLDFLVEQNGDKLAMEAQALAQGKVAEIQKSAKQTATKKTAAKKTAAKKTAEKKTKNA